MVLPLPTSVFRVVFQGPTSSLVFQGLLRCCREGEMSVEEPSSNDLNWTRTQGNLL